MIKKNIFLLVVVFLSYNANSFAELPNFSQQFIDVFHAAKEHKKNIMNELSQRLNNDGDVFQSTEEILKVLDKNPDAFLGENTWKNRQIVMRKIFDLFIQELNIMVTECKKTQYPVQRFGYSFKHESWSKALLVIINSITKMSITIDSLFVLKAMGINPTDAYDMLNQGIPLEKIKNDIELGKTVNEILQEKLQTKIKFLFKAINDK